MSKIFTANQFIEKLKWLVNSVPNFYLSKDGTWCNYYKDRQAFAMDCVVSIKGLLWGFKADKNKQNGGGVYLSNGVADFGANEGINYCSDVSTDFNNLVPGEYLCMKGTKYSHAGVYLGNGKVFECTTGWGVNRCVISEIDKYGNRYYNGVKNLAKWTYHGKLQYIDYGSQPSPSGNGKTRELQHVMNQQYNCGLAEDNSFGPLTYKECMNHYLYLGKVARIHIKWLQTRLIELGYSCGSCGVDGSFGYDTLSAVKRFQRDRGLVVDGNVGGATHRELVK